MLNWKWRAKSNYPFVAAITPTAGGIVFVAASAAISTRWILPPARNSGEGHSEPAVGSEAARSRTVDGVQKVAVADNFTMAAWPLKPRNAKVVILGLDSAAAKE